VINSQLALNVAGRFLHRPRRVAEKAVDVVLDETVTVMAKKDRVELRAFGAFSVKDKTMHKRLNPVASMPESAGASVQSNRRVLSARRTVPRRWGQ
jgi:nucleoid DNA-binding protein